MSARKRFWPVCGCQEVNGDNLEAWEKAHHDLLTLQVRHNVIIPLVEIVTGIVWRREKNDVGFAFCCDLRSLTPTWDSRKEWVV